MIFEIEVSEQVDEDLRGIYEYIAFELQSPDNAIGQLARLEESIISLEQMPERFHRYEKEPWKSRGLRMMPVDNYCVLYISDMKQEKVSIVRVMYGGRDIDSQLRK
ncbi:MAG: type II toxin-antitoxin system RelE/ParE family toxin [Velocimicrobium sp.]